VTVWLNRDAMAEFRRSGPHLKAMPKLLDWCDEAAVAPCPRLRTRCLNRPKQHGGCFRTDGFPRCAIPLPLMPAANFGRTASCHAVGQSFCRTDRNGALSSFVQAAHPKGESR
jgi:hypothetical protein